MSRRFNRRCATVRILTALVVTLMATPLVAPAPNDNPCDPGEEPDVIVSDIYETRRWGRVGTITAFSIGTYSCNIGNCWLNWIPDTNEHPVISGNMYRLMDGRFEQIGQSWLKHGFYALSGDLCGGGCIPTDGTHLGVLCSDPYSAYLNGEQDRLGPKFEVNPYTAEFPYPATDLFIEGNDIYKRLQVANWDLEPTMNPGAQYFVDSQYVTRDDAAAGNQNNNSSYAKVNVSASSGIYDISVAGPTRQEMPGIVAWADNDPEVELTTIEVPGDGLLFVAAKVSAVSEGLWHYEYAVQNLNVHRAVREFRVPFLPGTGLTNIEFNDVDYHSGEPYDSTDWPAIVANSGIPHELIWRTSSYFENPDANALRWDTLYNFRFDANLPPIAGEVKLGLFRPGFPDQVVAQTLTPALCNDNGTCDAGEEICGCVDDCVPPATESFCADGLDDDCDGRVDCFDADCCVGSVCDGIDHDADTVAICLDCDDLAPNSWSTPGEVRDLIFKPVFNQLALWWTAPLELGGTSADYAILRSTGADDFLLGTTCLYPASSANTYYFDTESPEPGTGFCYLVRASNRCPDGEGSAGTDSDGAPREAASCP